MTIRSRLFSVMDAPAPPLIADAGPPTDATVSAAASPVPPPSAVPRLCPKRRLVDLVDIPTLPKDQDVLRVSSGQVGGSKKKN
jgi:hypothetical protein